MMGFADTVAAAGTAFLDTAREAARALVELVGEETIETSPIGQPELWKRKPPADYKPGAFKSNWKLGIDAAEGGFDPDRTASFFVSGLDRVPTDPLGHRYVFSNAAPYAFRIEFERWAHGAPNGVVGPVSLEFSRLLGVAVERAKSGARAPQEV